MHAGWDQHDHPYNALEAQCHDLRGISATLVQDLKDRGLLEDARVTGRGDFGRTLYCQAR